MKIYDYLCITKLRIMKRFTLIFICLLLAGNTFAWSRLGHATVAKIAETHLTKKAKKTITKYLDGRSIVKYASFADDYKNELVIDYGFEPNNTERIGVYPHTFEVDSNFKPFRGINDNGRYVKNCLNFIEKYTEELKHRENLTNEEIKVRIALLVHFIGDMHCPEHIRYNPEDMTIGYYKVKFDGKDIRYHTLWDNEIIALRDNFGFGDLAALLDTYTKKQQQEIIKGDVYEWAEQNAHIAYPVHQIKEGEVLNKLPYLNKYTPLAEEQILKAGYRLAKVLNEIFN